jgi:hypothetical protein
MKLVGLLLFAALAPGGHCEDCGKCDDFFGPHNH